MVHLEVQKGLQAYKEARKNLLKLESLHEAHVRRETLSEAMREHSLGGTYRGHREYHIESDWLLVYCIDERGLVLAATRTGSYNELLGL